MPLLALTLALACDGEGLDTASSEPAPPSPAIYSGDACPTIEDGKNKEFISAGIERELRVVLPEEPLGAPVVFAWHWLGGSAKEMLNYTEVERLAEEMGAIVVAPQSCCGVFEWPFVPGEAAETDLTFFDDMLSCLHEQYEVDLDRIYTTGMSAGGLWASYLTMHRAEHLAASMPMSGGTEGMMNFEVPGREIPTLLVWGGVSDVLDFGFGEIDFHAANASFSTDLQASGSWVGHCIHDTGHWIPDEFPDLALQFFGDHQWDDPSPPYADGMPEGYPSWCGLPDEMPPATE